jgi:hypothetical protein
MRMKMGMLISLICSLGLGELRADDFNQINSFDCTVPSGSDKYTCGNNGFVQFWHPFIVPPMVIVWGCTGGRCIWPKGPDRYEITIERNGFHISLPDTSGISGDSITAYWIAVDQTNTLADQISILQNNVKTLSDNNDG